MRCVPAISCKEPFCSKIKLDNYQPDGLHDLVRCLLRGPELGAEDWHQAFRGSLRLFVSASRKTTGKRSKRTISFLTDSRSFTLSLSVPSNCADN
jgi:hypothetical protein